MRWWDIPGVLDIESEVFPDTAWTAGQFWSELARDNRRYLVAELNGDIIAYAGAMVNKPTADIQTIAVRPDHRGRGIARRLLVRLLEEAESHGCAEVLLEVGADNESAIALYKKECFEVIARRTSYYGHGRDALIMRRRGT